MTDKSNELQQNSFTLEEFAKDSGVDLGTACDWLAKGKINACFRYKEVIEEPMTVGDLKSYFETFNFFGKGGRTQNVSVDQIACIGSTHQHLERGAPPDYLEQGTPKKYVVSFKPEMEEHIPLEQVMSDIYSLYPDDEKVVDTRQLKSVLVQRYKNEQREKFPNESTAHIIPLSYSKTAQQTFIEDRALCQLTLDAVKKLISDRDKEISLKVLSVDSSETENQSLSPYAPNQRVSFADILVSRIERDSFNRNKNKPKISPTLAKRLRELETLLICLEQIGKEIGCPIYRDNLPFIKSEIYVWLKSFGGKLFKVKSSTLDSEFWVKQKICNTFAGNSNQSKFSLFDPYFKKYLQHFIYRDNFPIK